MTLILQLLLCFAVYKVQELLPSMVEASPRASITAASLADEGVVIVAPTLDQAVDAVNVIEEAAAYKLLIDMNNWKQDELAAKVGKSRSHVANIMRLLSLAPPKKQRIRIH